MTIHTTAPMAVGSAAASAVHRALPVSWRMVRQVVPQGKCSRHSTSIHTALLADTVSPVIIRYIIITAIDITEAFIIPMYFLISLYTAIPTKDMCRPLIASRCAIPFFWYSSLVLISSSYLSPNTIDDISPALSLYTFAYIPLIFCLITYKIYLSRLLLLSVTTTLSALHLYG